MRVQPYSSEWLSRLQQLAPGAAPDSDTLICVAADRLLGYATPTLVLDHEPAHAFPRLLVAPECRRQGVGSLLFTAILQGLTGLGRPVTLHLAADAAAPAELALARKFGLKKDGVLIGMTRPHLHELTEPRYPDGYTLRTPTVADGAAWVAVRANAYAWDPGRVNPSEAEMTEWLASEEYQPATCRLLFSPSGAAVGLISGHVDGSIGVVSTVAVSAAEQGAGLGKALLQTGLHLLAAAGATSARLTVDAHNPTRALPLYHAMGFSESLRYQMMSLHLHQ